MIPKIIFREMTLEENINLIKWEYFEKDGPLNIHSLVIKYFPELSHIDEKLSKEEIYNIIENVVKEKYNKMKDKLKKEVQRYNSIWNKYNDAYFKTLSKYLNVKWPGNHTIIDAQIGLTPVFPRYLNSFGFSLAIGIEEKEVIRTSAHETLHFLWFEKWKELYPECPRIEYDSPYITWQYSEMVTDPILNSKEIKKVININERAYRSFYDIKDGNDYMMDNLKDIYNSNLTIEEKITKGFEYIKTVLEKGNINKKR